MKLKWMKLGVASLLITTVVGVAAACGGGEPEELSIPVQLQDNVLQPETITVKKDDTVTLEVRTDQAGEFHLHGYDIPMDLEPGIVNEFTFVADIEGRFNITFHEEGDHEDGEEGEETVVGMLEVRPR